jgi:AcrR family transcriptional regulator
MTAPRPKKKHTPTPRVRREEVRRRILETAGRLFVERGLEATSLDAVARAAGFSKGAVYSNFAGKDALCFELLSAGIDARVAQVAAAAGAGDAASRMERAGETLLRIVGEEPGWQVFFVELWLRCVRNPDLARQFAAKRRLMRRQIATVLQEQASATGMPLPLPADQLAVAFLALSNGLGLEGLIDRAAVPPDLMGRLFAWTLRGRETS